MPRTSIIKGYTQRISTFNDQLWYFMFVSEEFSKQLTRFSANAAELYTSDVFMDNQFASRIYVRVKNLPSHEEKNRRVNYGATLSTVYEIAANYLRALFDMLKEYNALPHHVWNHRMAPEKNLHTLMTRNGLPLPPKLILTLLAILGIGEIILHIY